MRRREILLLGGVLAFSNRSYAQRGGSGGLAVGQVVPSLTLGGVTDSSKPTDLGALRGKPTLLLFGSCT